MTNRQYGSGEPPENQSAGPAPGPAEKRRERLAASLRANLRRRKDQIRTRKRLEAAENRTGPPEPAGGDE